MTDRSKFEEMLERLINEDRAGAEELFHEIVVEKSREIYQNIIESEDEEDEEDDLEEATDEEVDESEEDELEESDEEDLEEMFGLDEFEVEAPVMGGDATDDMMGDMGMDMGGEDDMDMGDEGEGDVEDRVADLEDALEDLRAEFEKLMGDEEGDDEGDDEGDMGDMDDEDDEEETKEVFAPTFEAKHKDKEKEKSKGKQTAAEQMREYVEKVSAKMGDNGVNNKSAVAGKNDMGGTTANIAKSFSTEKGGTQGGLLKPTTSVEDFGNVNKPGANAGKTAFKKKEPGHGAETKGKSETADNKQSLLRQAKR
jgi:hypothetical protein